MSLIKSISGIRGTIGGPVGEGLTPIDIVKFTYAYCAKLRERRPHPDGSRYKVVVGKDARISGEMVEQLVCGTLAACGIDVVKAGYASTPTTEMAVVFAKADGGIILTASHNPRQWNALKLLNEKGEFLNAAEGQAILDCAESGEFDFAPVDELGHITEHDFTDEHIQAVIDLKAVDEEAVRDAGFKVVLDPVNSVGAIIMPRLLERMGVECIMINGTPDGNFAHNPEPLPKNLTVLSETVIREHADLGISVDPDVDRLAFICENGKMFGEEYTLVSVADYVLGASKTSITSQTSATSLNTVSNLSSTRALRDVTQKHGGTYSAAAVGEVNVTTKMKEVGAVIGGEGNGGVIYPESHYGRDALVGIGLFLSSLAQKGMTATQLRATFPDYQIAKNRIDLTPETDVDAILVKVKEMFAKDPEATVNDIDGVKIDFPTKWVHLRKSNTEPIIRVYSEAQTMEEADEIGKKLMQVVYDMQ